ncbi:MAG: MATE family efflux transporter [Anaerotignum sp.]|jgi:putative MATE family efflux protein|nr:MATE family efflux transporter [Anaerotignum sp.]
MNPKVKQLCSYIFPAVGSLFVTYLYNVMDGIFVGQGVGSAALGAVNIGVPFITFAVAIVAMFPMGGATIIAIRMGRDDKAGANQAFMSALTLTILTAVALTIMGTVFSQQIVDLSGARDLGDEMRRMSADYLFYYSAFSLPMLMSNCLSVFVRNDGSPTLSFAGMCAGAVSNIFLDWLFIFPLQLGVIGAAVASGLGQIVSLLVLLSHFIRKHGNLRIRRFTIQPALIRKICKRGAPEAVTQLTTPVTALCYNLVLADLVGDIGVSTYSVLSFIYSLANAVLSGVAQGLQPLWGNSYGKRDTKEINDYFRFGITVNLVLSVLVYAGLVFFNEPTICIFSQEIVLVKAASKALPVFALSFIPMALNLVYTSLLYSTKRTKQSDIIAICRGIVIKAIAIFCIPVIWGVKAIWAAPFAAEMITFAIAVVLTRKTKLIYQ